MEHRTSTCPFYSCASCSAQEIEVQVPVMKVLGYVRQEPSGFFYPWFLSTQLYEALAFSFKVNKHPAPGKSLPMCLKIAQISTQVRMFHSLV